MTEDHTTSNLTIKRGLNQYWKKLQFDSVLMDAELQKAS
jgi:hypothetical protein